MTMISMMMMFYGKGDWNGISLKFSNKQSKNEFKGYFLYHGSPLIFFYITNILSDPC